MKTIYFISNNLVSNINIIYPKTTSFNEVREKTMLSSKGEELAKKISTLDIFENIEVIYSSHYFGAMNTSKYIADAKDLDIILDSRLGERVVGELGSNEYRFLKGMQEHDFSYKLNNGESLQEVNLRMKSCIKDILKSDYENVIIVSHNIALLSLFLEWCNKGFNLDDRLILDYQEEVIFDGVFRELDLLKVQFDDNKVISIERLK